jgi:regulator of sigma E protease
MLQTVIAILGLALLIVIHEAGHFTAARLCGMRVERFSIGFGKALLSFKRGDTIFQISPIPLGGFVQINGMNPHEEFDRNDPYVYPNRPRWMRFFVLVAGPLSNYLTAILIGFLVLITYGQYTGTTTVDEIVPGTAAAVAGLKSGDVLAKVNGVTAKKPSDITHVVRTSNGNTLSFEILREGKPIQLAVAPRKDPASSNYMIGVRFGQVRERGPVGEALKMAVMIPVAYSTEMLKNIWGLITGTIKGGLTGPLGIASEMASAAKQGLLRFMEILILISVALGLFNLLPVPGLDGGRLVFVGISALRRKDVDEKLESKIHMVGILALMLLLVYVSVGDIRGFIGKKFG